MSISFGQGGVLTFSASTALLSVSDNRGHSLTFTYTSAYGGLRIAKVTTNGGAVHTYGYDDTGRLTSVTYPDGAVRGYQYPPAVVGNAVNPLAGKLTRVIDENGSAFASITYDSLGRATSTQHGTGVELTTFSYSGSSTTVTNSLGVAETMTFGTTANRQQTQTLTTSCTNGCGGSQLADLYSYDGNGNVASVTNKQGVQTCFSFDLSRNRPVKVVDGLAASAACGDALASPPASSRVRTYQWHAVYSVPMVITGPQSKTVFNYDSAGRKLAQVDVETGDLNGAYGASAQTVGLARSTSWTYNGQGSVLTVKAPRTDINATTSFAYDSGENLTTVTSPAGLVTALSNYDANGRPGLITRPNGLQTTLTYDARGRTTSISTGGAVTTYGYDAAGLLVSAALPSGVSLTFAYDAAHRLVLTQDSLGNRVERVLDTEGNVLQETVKGNGGAVALARQAAYEQLSRMTALSKAQ